jgi:enoyl-CoA hydratase
MVNRVVPREALQDEVDRMAARIAQCDPFALRLVKRSINRGLEMQGLRAAIDAHFDTHQLSHLSEGFQRQRAAGLGKAIQAAARSAL